MLNIQRFSNGKTLFTLSGRIEFEDVAELQRLLNLEEDGKGIAFDLQDVTLVDREALRFLAVCEGDCIELQNCPAYVRDSIDAERSRNHQPGT